MSRTPFQHIEAVSTVVAVPGVGEAGAVLQLDDPHAGFGVVVESGSVEIDAEIGDG